MSRFYKKFAKLLDEELYVINFLIILINTARLYCWSFYKYSRETYMHKGDKQVKNAIVFSFQFRLTFYFN